MANPAPTHAQTPTSPPSASSAAELVLPTTTAAVLADVRVLFDPANASMRDAMLNALGSKKWLVMLLVIAGCFALVLAKSAVWVDVKGTILAVAALYLGTQGAVDVAKHVAVAKVASAQVAKPSVTNIAR